MQPDASINILNMMRHSIRMASKNRSSDTGVLLRRHSSYVTDLVKKLFPDKKGEPVIKGVRANT